MNKTSDKVMVLNLVEWYVPPEDEFDNPQYRCCDICFLSATDDVLAGKSVTEFRQFYQVPSEALTVCEHCLGEFLKEEQPAR